MIAADSEEASAAVQEFLSLIKEHPPNPGTAQWHLTGSIPIVGVGNDVDIVVLAGESFAEALVQGHGFMQCGEYVTGDRIALRNGSLNVIVVFNQRAYTIWLESLMLAQQLQRCGVLLDKEARAVLFEGLRSMAMHGVSQHPPTQVEL